MLKLAEEALDFVPLLVQGFVPLGRVLAVRSWRDDGLGLVVCDVLSNIIAIVSLVGDDRACGDALHEVDGLGGIVDLAGGEDEANRPALCIGNHVDLAGQTSS